MSPARAIARRGFLLTMSACLLMPGCQPDRTATAGGTIAVAPASRLQAAETPVDAVLVLRDRLLARDGAGFARLAVPPSVHVQLIEAWSTGRSRWPVDELPLDAKLPKMLAVLQEKGAESKLMATFRRQFQGADRDIDQAIRTLVLFGGEYVRKDADYRPEERDHVGQALAAIGEWALAAPLSDPARAQPFFGALVAAAQRSGIDGKAGDKAFAQLGMQASLNRLSPFLATLLAQLRQHYGLDVDATLRGMQVRLMEQTGDSARVRLQYTLAGRPVDAIVPVVRIDGRWYLANYLRRAEASLAGGPPATGVRHAGGSKSTSP